jgi:hypothetical protein
VRPFGIKTVCTAIFSRMTPRPRVHSRNFKIKFPSVLKPSWGFTAIPSIDKVHPIEKPSINDAELLSADVSQIDYGSAAISPRAAHIVIQETRADVVIGETGSSVEFHEVDYVPPVFMKEPEYSMSPKLMLLDAPDCDVDIHEPDVEFYGIRNKVKSLESEVKPKPRRDIRFAYGGRFAIDTINPRLLAKSELLFFWRALMDKMPYGSGKDLEMLGIFEKIEVDRFVSIKYDRKENRLNLKPKPFHQQKGERLRRYDIIYGRMKSEGRLVSAVLESD